MGKAVDLLDRDPFLSLCLYADLRRIARMAIRGGLFADRDLKLLPKGSCNALERLD